MDRSTGDADKAMKRKADDDGTAARSRPRVRSTLVKCPALSAMFGEVRFGCAYGMVRCA
jgi:hypothetical protein